MGGGLKDETILWMSYVYGPLAFFLTYIITFAVMTPLGIGIGLAVTELAADSDHIGYVAATGTLQGDVSLLTLQIFTVL